MRTLATFLVLLCLGICLAPIADVQAQNANKLKKVCKSTAPVSKFLVKREISTHIGNSDPRARGWTLVCGRECPSLPAAMYYCDGTLAARFGYYGPWSKSHGGNGKPRAYGNCCGVGSMIASDIQRTARKKSCGKNLYIQMSSTTKTCRHFNALDSRVGTPW